MADEARMVRVDAEAPGAGEMITVEVEGTTVAIASIGGTLLAFDDACTHRGCSLAEGMLAGPTVTCRCHKGRFDLRTGEVLDGPPPTPLRIRAVELDGDALLVEA